MNAITLMSVGHYKTKSNGINECSLRCHSYMYVKPLTHSLHNTVAFIMTSVNRQPLKLIILHPYAFSRPDEHSGSSLKCVLIDAH